jgi:hypothetical protein
LQGLLGIHNGDEPDEVQLNPGKGRQLRIE